MKAEKIVIDQPDLVFHEQQALKRLKQLELAAREQAQRARNPRLLRRLLIGALKLFKPSELVREVAPGQAPQGRHEWERQSLKLWL